MQNFPWFSKCFLTTWKRIKPTPLRRFVSALSRTSVAEVHPGTQVMDNSWSQLCSIPAALHRTRGFPQNTAVSHLRRGGLHQGWMNLSHQRVSHVIICYKLQSLRICSNVHKCWNFPPTSQEPPELEIWTLSGQCPRNMSSHCINKNITETWWSCWHAQIQSSSNVWLSMRFKHKLYSKPEEYQRCKSNQEFYSLVTSSGSLKGKGWDKNKQI